MGSEFQSRSYGAMVSHTTIVFTRYIILEWLRRNQNDEKTYGNVLQSLMALFVEHISTLSADITSVLKSKVTEWIARFFFYIYYPGKKSSMLRHAFSSRRYCGFYILRVPPEAVRFPVPVAQFVEVKQENGIG